MGLGTLGALGAAVNTLGRSVRQAGERSYSEELNKKIQEAQESKAEALRTRQENFQVEQEKTRQKNAIKLAKEREKTKAAKPGKEQNYTLKDPESGDAFVATYSYKDKTYTPTGDPDAKPLTPDEVAKYRISLVRNTGASDAEYKKVEKIERNYNKEYLLLEKEAASVAKLKSLLTYAIENPGNAYVSEAIKNANATVFSNGSQSIKEVTRWSNLGPLSDRIMGAFSQFFKGVNIEGQYEKGLELVNQYMEGVIMPRKENMDSYYTKKAKRADFIEPRDILRDLIIEVPNLPGSFEPLGGEQEAPLSSKIPTRDEIIKKIEAEGSPYRDQKDIDAIMNKFDYERYSLEDTDPQPGVVQRFR